MYEMLRPVMQAWYAKEMAASGVVPKPVDAALVPAEGDDADAVLLVGNGPAHGWGVVTHQLSLAGQLGRALRTRTSRPCAVNYIGDEAMNISSTLAWIGNHDITAYDVVVVMVGMNDAVRLTRLPVWRARFEELLDCLVADTRSTTRILVVGMQPVRSVTPYDKALGTVAQRHATRLNFVAEQLTEKIEQATYMTLGAPQLEKERPHGSSAVYGSWAQEIADCAAPLFETVRTDEGENRSVQTLHGPRFSWEGGAQLVEQAMTGGSAELQRLASRAQEIFDVDVAAVTLVDGDRLWYAVNTHQLPMSIPREVAYCSTVVAEDQFLVVPDAQRDPRFRGNAFIDVTGMNFYAGYPLHAVDGRTIGTFCLLNRRTRPAESVSLEELRAVALQAQTELRRYEADITEPPGSLTPASIHS